MMRADFFGVQHAPVTEAARQNFKNVLIGNMAYSPEEANTAIQSNKVDAIAFGHHFISNPNLVQKLREGRPLSEPDQSTYYTPGPKGYVDYPAN
jgi:N-ethylmaleimide reductase